jgi:hypothetical protein
MPDVIRPRARLAAFFPVLVLAACGGGDKVSGPGSVAGAYALQSVNGQPVPMLLGQSDDGRTFYVAGGSLELRADEGYSSTLTFRVTGGGQSASQSEQDAGTYTVSGSTVTLRSQDGSSTTATVGGGRLTSVVPVEGGALTFVYAR